MTMTNVMIFAFIGAVSSIVGAEVERSRTNRPPCFRKEPGQN